MFPATITINNAHDLTRVMAALGVSADEKVIVASIGENTVKVTSSTTKSETKPSPQSSKAETTKSAEQPDAQTAATEPTASAGKGAAQETKLDYLKDVKPKILALIKAGKRDATLKMLNDKFGTETAQTIPADKWPALLTELGKLEG